MQRIKKSETTAAYRRIYFTAVDDDDVQVRKTAAYTGFPTLFMSLNGAAATTPTNSPVEIDSGDMPGSYYIELTEAECATEGYILLSIVNTDVEKRELLVAITSTSYFDVPTVDVTKWNGTAVATPTTAGVPRVDVKAMEANTLTDTALATSAVTEIQSGLATAASLSTVAGYIDTEIGTIISALTVIDDFLDTEIAAIKAKTDLLPNVTVTAMDANVITSSQLAVTAIEEIQSGLATAAALTVVDDFLDTEIAAIKAKTDLLPNVTVTSLGTDAVNADALAASAVAEIAAALSIPSAATIAAAVDAELTTQHGAGSWNASALDEADFAAAVWNKLIEDGYSAAELLRGLVAVLINDGEDMNGPSPIFKAMDGVRTRITGVTTDETRNSTIVSLAE